MQLLPLGRQQFFDNGGAPLSGGKVYFFVPGTTTPANTWSSDDPDGPVNLNPVILDTAGRAVIWGDTSYHQVVHDADDNLIWEADISAPASSVELAGPNGSNLVGFLQSDVSAMPRTSQDKMRDVLSTLDFPSLTAADAASPGFHFVPRGVVMVNTAMTLTKNYWFDDGAVFRVAEGVTLTLSGGIKAEDYQRIFDQSLGGLVTGNITNEYYSVCWFGADRTGASLAGAQVQNAIDAQLARRLKIPYGTYDMTGSQIKQAGVHVFGVTWQPGVTFGTGYDSPILNWKTDMGAGMAQWSIMSRQAFFPGGTGDARYFAGVSLEGVTMNGPRLNNFGFGYVPNCQHDGIMLGTGGNCQMHLRNVTVNNTRYGYTAWANDGHSTFENMRGAGNFIDWYFLSTGGDWRWTGENISATSQLAVIGAPRNGTFGVDPFVEYWYFASVAYVMMQTDAIDSRMPGTTTVIFAAGGIFRQITVENLGNAFIWLTPMDSNITCCRFDDARWVSPTPSGTAGISADPGDWAVKLGNMAKCVWDGSTGAGGIGNWGAGTNGVFQVYQQDSSKYVNYTTVPPVPLLTSPSLAGYVMSQYYQSPAINFMPGDSTATYTMTSDEAASIRYLAPKLVQKNGTVFPGSHCLIVGSTVVITLSAAIPASGYLQCTLQLYGDVASI